MRGHIVHVCMTRQRKALPKPLLDEHHSGVKRSLFQLILGDSFQEKVRVVVRCAQGFVIAISDWPLL